MAQAQLPLRDYSKDRENYDKEKSKADRNKLEGARRSGKPVTGKDMDDSSRKVLSELLMEDRKRAATKSASPKTFKSGGPVRKSGMAKVHKGEYVLTKKMRKSMPKRMSK